MAKSDFYFGSLAAIMAISVAGPMATSSVAAAQTGTAHALQTATRPPVPATGALWFTTAEGRQVHGVAGVTRYTWRVHRSGRGSIAILGPRPVRSDEPEARMQSHDFRLSSAQLRRFADLVAQARAMPDENLPCPTDGTIDVVTWSGPTRGTVGIGHCEGRARIAVLRQAIAILRTAAGLSS